jgi:hypothetical protein
MIALEISFYSTPLPVIVVFLFVSILLFYLLGVKISNHKKIHNPESKAEGIGALEGALLGLLSLLLSFTFGMSASRYDTRKALIVQESNDIGSVISLCDMYPDATRALFSKELKEYVDTRISYYNTTESEVMNNSVVKSQQISNKLWKEIIIISKQKPDFTRDNQMITAFCKMTDIVISRDASRLSKVPELIVSLLILLTIIGAFIVGYGKKTKKNDWIIIGLYSIMTVLTIYTILDLDRPKRGTIKTNVPHEKIIELRNAFQ